MSIKVASIVLSIATFLSYILGFLRDKTLAYYFGQTGLTDMYNLAFVIPDFIFNFCIAGALAGVFIPIYIDHKERSQDEANELVSVFFTVMGFFITLICIVTFFITPWVLEKLVFENEKIDIAINLTRLMLLSPIILGLSNTIGSIHIAHKRFFTYSISSVVYNIGIILGIIIFHRDIGIYSAGIGVVFGAILHASIRLFDMKNIPFRFKFNFNFKHKGFQKILVSMLPRSFGLMSITAITFVFGVIGPSLIEGGFTAYTFARNFQSFPINLFGITIATAVLPVFSEYIARKEFKKLSLKIDTSIRQLIFLTLPASVVLAMLAPYLINILKGGAFSANDVQITSVLLSIMCVSIPLESISHLYTRGYNAFKNTYFPAFTNIVFAVSTILITYYTKDSFGIYSLSIGWSTGALLQCALLFIFFHYIYKFSISNIWSNIFYIFKIIIISVLLYLFLNVFSTLMPVGIASLIIGVVSAVLLFLTLSLLLKIKEVNVVYDIYKRIFP